MERLRFLDGIRGFAVCAVLLFHAGVAGVSGGLLGVDVFFVLSGYLITSLLCAEHRSSGTIRLSKFWGARARRLLPALLLLLLGVAVYAWDYRDSLDVTAIRGDAISTLLYFANWHFIFSNQGYFAQSTAPSPLLHMWSLAVEEQYYVIWPLVAVLVLRTRGPRLLARVAGVGAAASAALMAAMFVAGVGPDRLYYGTDTRAQALLVGSVLGAVASRREWRVVPAEWASTRRGRLVGPLIGLTGAGVLFWSWHSLNGQNAFLYEGGFLLVALAAGAVVTSVTSWRKSVLARVLSLRPVVYIGRISYGLYLYHWPLFLALDHAHTGLSGATLLAARLSSTFVAAVASFHLVEQPIRRAHLARSWRGLPFATGGALATAAVVVLATIPPAFAAAPVALVNGSQGEPRAEHAALSRAHAFTTQPIRFELFGDSVALSAAVGLSFESIPRYGVMVHNVGVLGCDFDAIPSLLGGSQYVSWHCRDWQTSWAQTVASYRPQVTGLLIGRFELADHFYQGSWRHVGQPEWDAHLLSELGAAVKILSAGGAHVVIFTFPYIDPPLEQPGGGPWPENVPSRVDAWNNVLRQAAADNPKTTTLIDLNHILDPDGHYTSTIDGVNVRKPTDGIHVTIDGGEWLEPLLLPEIGALGLQVSLKG